MGMWGLPEVTQIVSGSVQMCPQTLDTLCCLTLMLFWQNLLSMAMLTPVPDYNMLSQTVNLWSGKLCGLQQKQVTDVFHVIMWIRHWCGNEWWQLPVSVQFNVGVKVMGCHFPSAMVENSLEHLGVVKNMVRTQLCNKYPAGTLLSSTTKPLLRSPAAKIRMKP